MTRRNLMYAALITAAISTAVATAIAASGANMIQTTAAENVSPRMAELVNAYKQALEMVDTLAPDAATDQDAWAAVEDVFVNAQNALMNERPANAADYASKFDALVEIEASEGEFAVMKRLSEDAHALAQVAR